MAVNLTKSNKTHCMSEYLFRRFIDLPNSKKKLFSVISLSFLFTLSGCAQIRTLFSNPTTSGLALSAFSALIASITLHEQHQANNRQNEVRLSGRLPLSDGTEKLYIFYADCNKVDNIQHIQTKNSNVFNELRNEFDEAKLTTLAESINNKANSICNTKFNKS